MNGRFETSGIWPLSTEPAEGYGVDPASRNGRVVITHTNGKFIRLTDNGHAFVEHRADASQFDDHAVASLAAGKLIEAERAKRGREVELVD